MKSELVPSDSEVLRQKAKEVLPKDIGSKKIKTTLSKMRRALHVEPDGVAIAAPQVGGSLRIFMVKDLPDQQAGEKKDLVFINPEIIKKSQKKKKLEEGCLSLRWLYGEVLRHEKVTLTAFNEEGKKIKIGAEGLLSQIFQHEVDHLNGILFTDKAENVRDIPPETNGTKRN